MRARDKILLTVALAVIFFFLFGCSGEHYVPTPEASEGITSTKYLESLYKTYNEQYFRNRLVMVPVIDMFEESNMATTMCYRDGNCTIHFNPKFVLAPRVAELVMLHEMCHIKTWDTDVVTFGGTTEQADHGKIWRACMLQLDAEGAFREVIIDHYFEDNKWRD